jgi:hypothetical protein
VDGRVQLFEINYEGKVLIAGSINANDKKFIIQGVGEFECKQTSKGTIITCLERFSEN